MSTAHIILTNRDEALFAMVFDYGGVSITHIMAKFFRSPHARASCYARIARLAKAEYLLIRRLPSESGVGSGPFFVMVGPKARPLLAKHLNCSQSSLRSQTRAQVPEVLRHHLLTCDFRVSLELAAEASALVAGCDWTPEWELRRTPIKAKDPETQDVLSLVADGAFTLTLQDGSEATFYVEIDRGTMTQTKRLRARLRGYLLAAKENPVPVLWVTPSQTRIDTLSRLAAEEAEKLKGVDGTIFWLTTHEAVTPETALTGSLWQVVRGPAAHALLPAAVEVESDGGAPPRLQVAGYAAAEGVHA